MRKKERVCLSVEQMPTSWYNVKADLPFAMDPPMDPETQQPMGPEKLSRIFPMGLLEQEVSMNREIPIPEEVFREYVVYRPTPLIRASGLEEYLDTPARIYFKNESISPAGSHKVNTALAQAFFNAREGVKKLVTETGAGQWGSALAYAGQKFGMEVRAYMVRTSYDSKPLRRKMIELFGGSVIPSPSPETQSGRHILSQAPDSPGSLGIAISEAVEIAMNSKDANYALGSVLDHVLLHQTIIGQETRVQLSIIEEQPDILIACVGGGSNFGGFAFPFIPDRIEKDRLQIIAVEPNACPTLTQGEYRYDYGDTEHLTPMLRMYTLGSEFIPPPIHAGGLRYHGASPIVSRLVKEGLVEAEAYDQTDILTAAKIFTMCEGIIPAPESSHAIQSAIVHAKKCAKNREEKVIVFNLSGHGLMDLNSYDHIERLNHQEVLAGERK